MVIEGESTGDGEGGKNGTEGGKRTEEGEEKRETEIWSDRRGGVGQREAGEEDG